VNSDTIEETAERLRSALVDQVVKERRVHTLRIKVAMQTVPRHVFVPDASLEEAYADSTVNIKQNSDGTSISCASQPSVVGLMLEQLQPQPGDKVLELGAGTGYNAGLLAHLVGEGGHVTTIDVDDDLVDGARSHLAAAGIETSPSYGAAMEHLATPMARPTTASLRRSVRTVSRTPGWTSSRPAVDCSCPSDCAAASPARSPTSTRTVPGSPSAAR
jgi:predicted O-methyltransferase YrrM